MQSTVSAVECKRAKKLLEELVKIRWFKIVRNVEQGSVPEDRLAEGERRLVEQATVAVRAYQEFLKRVLEGRFRKRAYALIRFLKPVPALVGVDLKAYGPFEKEDVANLPVENAEALVRQGLAVFLRVQS